MTEPDPTSLIARIKAAQPDPKAAAILEAGYQTFVSFGHRRASMQDIAERAGMSRAALYLHFKNKDDIFGAMMAAYFEASAQAAAEALAREDDPARALSAAFAAQLGDAGEGLMRSPHFEEMMAIKHAVTAEILREGHAKLVQVYAKWLEAGVQTGRIDPAAVAGSAERTARVMLAGLDGMKSGGFDWDGYLAARKHLARIFARSLRP
ncbi:helix-turn-helix domain-containing protein [Gymnodinialimonas sp. 2305UL16-5]|uniref:TetR/AcrR family transcriptional regulator n=1 Tax=Gymnodinialimonas mytili TaxID=3126503 RepID=UPI0030B5A4CC